MARLHLVRDASTTQRRPLLRGRVNDQNNSTLNIARDSLSVSVSGYAIRMSLAITRAKSSWSYNKKVGVAGWNNVVSDAANGPSSCGAECMLRYFAGDVSSVVGSCARAGRRSGCHIWNGCALYAQV